MTTIALLAFAAGFIIGAALRRPTPCAECDSREWERKNWG